jgi:hypothetical protein
MIIVLRECDDTSFACISHECVWAIPTKFGDIIFSIPIEEHERTSLDNFLLAHLARQ